MERKAIDEQDLEKIVGGTIVFSTDLKTCGRNCDNQYQVLNISAVLQYIQDNKNTQTEYRMLKNMVAAGYLAPLQ